MKQLLRTLLPCLLFFCATNASYAVPPTTFCNAATCYTATACFGDTDIKMQTYTFSTVHNIYKNGKANINLYMDVYSPCGLPASLPGTAPGCSNCKRPFILLIHPGGFRDGCRTLMQNECMSFAERGYVVATIDYRLGWVDSDELVLPCNNNVYCYTDPHCDSLASEDNCEPQYLDSNRFAVYRAIQDAHAAMRFIKHFAADLNIDTRYMFVGGQSAGAVTALNLAFLTQLELSTAMPQVVAKLGNIDTVGNSYTDNFDIAGIYNNWGAVLDTSYIKGTKDAIPVISFQGSLDPVVPYGRNAFLSCPYYDTSCGSLAIYRKLRSKYPTLSAELFSCKSGHGILQTDGKSLYRVEKAVCFFKNVVMGVQVDTIVERNEKDGKISVDSLMKWFPLDCPANPIARQAIIMQQSDEASVFADQSGVITCNYSLSAEKNIAIRVFDMTGRLVSKYTATQSAGAHTYHTDEISVSGVYIVSVTANGTYVATQKVVITH